MADSFKFRRDPFKPQPLTPGPLGYNDSASPDSLEEYRGETPGPLGMNDYADPNATGFSRDSPAIPNLGSSTNAAGARRSVRQNQSSIDENSPLQSLVVDPRVMALLDVIAYAEGADYDTMVKGEGSVRIMDFSKHPNTVVTLNKNLKSTAAGRYQFLYSTWIGLGMRDFSPRSQDLAGVKLFKRRKMLKPLLDGNVALAIKNGNREWASLPGSPYGQPTHCMEELLKVYDNSLYNIRRRR